MQVHMLHKGKEAVNNMDKKKKNFEYPKIEVIEIDDKDLIITASDPEMPYIPPFVDIFSNFD